MQVDYSHGPYGLPEGVSLNLRGANNSSKYPIRENLMPKLKQNALGIVGILWPDT